MRWDKVDARWKKRKDTPEHGKLESDVTYSIEMWPIPGEDPLEVRVCTRAGHPMTSFCNARETEKTSIVLHTTAGYGGFSTLMGGDGDGRQASAHFMLGRDGIAYLLVKTEWLAWHATWWNDNSVGIEVDTICQLFKGKGNTLHSEYGPNDVYCTTEDTGAFMEKPWPGHGNARYWATWTEEQYVGCARLLKAISHKHDIPRVVLPEPARYNPFPPADRAAERRDYRKKFKGLCTHLNIDPARRIDIGPFIDWDKLLRYGEYKTADCLSAPAYTPPVGGMTLYTPGAAPSGGGASSGGSSGGASGGGASGGNSSGGNSSGGGKGGTSGGASGGTSSGGGKGGTAGGAGGGSTTTQDVNQLPPPVQIDNRTLRVRVGKKGGRIALTVRKPGEPLPTAPKPGDLPEPLADGKRDDFIRAAMNFLGCPYKAGSDKPKDGVDGAGLISLCLKRVGLLKEEDADFDGAALYGIWPHVGGTKNAVPEEILPGDIAWFGKGDHDTDACQHPMIYLGGERVLGPLAAGGANDGAVQVIHLKDVPENFGGWTHIDDLGVKTEHTAHPGDPEVAGVKLTGALLPLAPASRYDALKELVKRQKGTWDDAKGKINLVGVKNMHDRCMISPRPDDWNDTLFAAFLDDDGHKCCLELKASLNPGTDEAKKGTWQLWEGPAKFKLADGEKIGAKALQPDGKIKGWQDKEGSGAPRVTDPKPDPKGGGDQPKPKTDTPDNPKSGAADPGGAFVFDAAGKKLSVKFGIRMMRALMEWELKEVAKGKFEGCKYSSYPGSPPYTPPSGLPNAWPDLRKQMKIEPSKKVSAGGKDYDVWHAFGMNWGGVHETNCCNSQMAAIFAANPDGILRIKRDSGVEEVDVVHDSPPSEGLKYHGKATKDSKGFVFAVTWIQGGGTPYSKDGKSLNQSFAKTSPAWAMEWLGVGESVCNWGDRKSLKKVRIGDDGMWMSHNWLVGDVRYKITFTNGKTARCDQSSFARVEKGVTEKYDLHGGRAATKEDLDWIEANEEEFEKRLAAFFDAKKLELFGEELDVKSIEPSAASVFSGNCEHWFDGDTEHGTAGGKIFSRKKGADWSFNDSRTRNGSSYLGVSRLWNAFPADGSFGFARWYDNAGGAELRAGGAAPQEGAKKPEREPVEAVRGPAEVVAGKEASYEVSKDSRPEGKRTPTLWSIKVFKAGELLETIDCAKDPAQYSMAGGGLVIKSVPGTWSKRRIEVWARGLPAEGGAKAESTVKFEPVRFADSWTAKASQKKRPGVGPDIGFGDYSEAAYRKLGAAFEKDFADADGLGHQTDAQLFHIFRDMAVDNPIFSFTHGTLVANTRAMIDKFQRSDSGGSYPNGITEYADATLTAEARKHASTKRFVDAVKAAFKEQLKSARGDAAAAQFFSLRIPSPQYSTRDDNWSGLSIAINDTWAFEAQVVDYELTSASKYRATLRLTIYDHFGLDPADVTKSGTWYLLEQDDPGAHDGFRAWFLLQHVKQYRPFVTRVEFDEVVEDSCP